MPSDSFGPPEELSEVRIDSRHRQAMETIALLTASLALSLLLAAGGAAAPEPRSLPSQLSAEMAKAQANPGKASHLKPDDSIGDLLAHPAFAVLPL
jgi:hypothetical protein